MPKVVDHKTRRDEISRIAAALIAKGGMEAATIREIARSSGYSKGVIEHYFDGKNELIGGALNWINHCFEQRVEALVADLSGLTALRKRIEATLPIGRAVRDEWKVRMVFWSLAAVQENLRVQQAQRFDKAVEFYAEDIAVAIARGEIPPDRDFEDLARRLFSSTIGLSTMAMYSPTQYNRAFLLKESENLIAKLASEA